MFCDTLKKSNSTLFISICHISIRMQWNLLKYILAFYLDDRLIYSFIRFDLYVCYNEEPDFIQLKFKGNVLAQMSSRTIWTEEYWSFQLFLIDKKTKILLAPSILWIVFYALFGLLRIT